MKINIHATRDSGWWVATSDDIDGFATQARRLDQIPELARDIAELADDVENPDDVEFVVHVDPAYASIADEAVSLAGQARELSTQASEAMRAAAVQLRDDGLTVRDIGQLLGVSYQRAQKLANA